jgi:hypothetical protein
MDDETPLNKLRTVAHRALGALSGGLANFRNLPEAAITKQKVEEFFGTAISPGSSIIRDETLALTGDKERIREAIQNDQMKPEQLALVLIANVSAKHLASGKYHIYRGLLSGIGQEIAHVFDKAVGRLLKNKYYSQQDAENHRKMVADEVKGVG